MEARRFDDDWRAWIRTNVARGCSKNGIFKILMDEGFTYEAIKSELNHEPSMRLDRIENPLRKAQEAARTAAQHLAGSGNGARSRQTTNLPNAIRLGTSRAEIYVVDDFLTADECQALATIVRSRLRPSTISDPDEPDKYFRTSRTCDLVTSSDDLLVRDVDDRICRYLGINPTYSEAIQGQHYDVGEEFKPHTDYFEAHELDQFGGATQGQRTWTVMIYLNNTELGGETRFRNLDVTITPQAGRAVIWNNLHADGRPNPDTMHHGMPVRAGCKTIMTRWFRERGDGPMSLREPHDDIPILTRVGFAKARMPDDLWNRLLDFYRREAAGAVRESVAGYISFHPNAGAALGTPGGAGGRPSDLIPLTAELKNETHLALKPVLEAWAGAPLEPTYVYGIRRYNRDATLNVHRDRVETHIASTILNVDQQVDEDWPLEIEDHYCRRHHMVLAPGEMLLYEGGRLRHGRPTPLRGTAYANVFVHYRLR